MPVLEPPPPPLVTLPAPPPELAETVRGLHLLAERVISPARERVTGNEIALRWTPGGFGTPRFGGDQQVRVEGAALVVVGGGQERRRPISSWSDAVALAGLPTVAGWEEPLVVDDAASCWLGDFFGLAYGALEALRANAPDGTEVRLWPEHFDIAIELGDEAAGLRANYGASPGDDDHAEPYVYVGPWSAQPPGPPWNATAFPGAELTLTDLLAAGDQRSAIDAFFAACRGALVVDAADG
jgi:hypothetical protein